MFSKQTSDSEQQTSGTGQSSSMIALGLFLAGLAFLPALASQGDSVGLQLFDSFYRTGALVFGGGHVVLPMLQVEVVHESGVSTDAFLAGYSAAQAVPGPMFTLAPFLGGTYGGEFNLVYALIALTGIFLPSFLLLSAALPVWNRLKTLPSLRAAIQGINASVVGLLLAAFYSPVATLAIKSHQDAALALAAYLLLAIWKLPVGFLVLFFSGIGWVLY